MNYIKKTSISFILVPSKNFVKVPQNIQLATIAFKSMYNYFNGIT